jgi:hypothetical protein
LRGGGAGVGAFVEAEEYVFKLVHACVGKQQRGVVVRDERRRGNDLMPLGLEELQEFGAEFVGFHGRGFSKINKITFRLPLKG